MAAKFSASLVLIAFNQEKYVADAVKSAFAQSLAPLEIVLSDDASSDATFEIMQKLAAEYSGPHRVVLNRNPTNLGLIRHIARASGLSSGELIIVMAGDDVSLPHRARTLMDEWVACGRGTVVMHSRVHAIDEAGSAIATPRDIERKYSIHGRPLDRIAREITATNGSTGAWSRDVIEGFPPLAEQNALEDTVLAFRALLLGGQILFVNEALVSYRVAVSTWIDPASPALSTRRIIQRIHRYLVCQRDSVSQMQRDLRARPHEAAIAASVARSLAVLESTAELSARPGLFAFLAFLFRSRGKLTARDLASAARFAFPRAYSAYWRTTHRRSN